jgi:hypothetical protein
MPTEVEGPEPQPPEYCEYSSGPCDQSFAEVPHARAVVLYPSEPEQLAATVEAAVRNLKEVTGNNSWVVWRDFATTGQIIFCSICKRMRFAEAVIADVTTLNFNLLFEIGFALGLDLPIIPIRDTSYVRDKHAFDELGLVDIIGYVDFQNSRQLSDGITARWPVTAIPTPLAELNLAAPLYVLKGPLETEGELRLLSVLKKSAIRFRAYDPVETPRLSLHQLRHSITSSLGLAGHLLHPDRQGALVHNARLALAAGIATASGKAVRLIQEGNILQPIDYRDIVVSYTDPNRIERLLEPTLLSVIQRLQTTRLRNIRSPTKLLQKLDIGDVAAENEIRPLRSYFVETGQYFQARRGHARLVTGRKGTGKTAIFYALRDSFGQGHSRIVLDLKPEGHQFKRLREVILEKLSPGLQEATLTAFWNAILLAELAHKIVEEEYSWANRDPERRNRFEALLKVYQRTAPAEKGDFSERLLQMVDKLIEQGESVAARPGDREVAEILFRGDIREVRDVLTAYLAEKEEIWILVDNLDKGWPTQGAQPEDILIVRTLLEATRKLQRQLEREDVNFHSLVFIRNDIYDLLIRETSDKGKDTAITLDWSDSEAFKEIFRKRVLASGELDGDFESVWTTIFSPNIGTRDSFSYVCERTLMRPRDFLTFLHSAIEVAINRGHDRVLEDDLLHAEKLYSEDLLKTIGFELRDVFPESPDLLYAFLGCRSRLSKNDVHAMLQAAGISEERIDDSIRLLGWFGILGVLSLDSQETHFAYDVRYDLTRLLTPIEKGRGQFVIHPAFRAALECSPGN